MQHGMNITKERFDLTNNKIYYIWGVWPQGHTPLVQLDGEFIEATLEEQKKVSALEGTQEITVKNGIPVKLTLHLPEQLESYRKLMIYAENIETRELWYTEVVKQLLERRSKIQYYQDSVTVDKESDVCVIHGWMVAAEPVEVAVLDEKNQPLSFKLKRTSRLDVSNLYQELDRNVDSGFYMEIQMNHASQIRIQLSVSGESVVKKISVSKQALLLEKADRYVKKGLFYLQTTGVRGLMEKIKNKMQNEKRKPQPYGEWIEKHLPTEQELEEQRGHVFAQNPKFSIVVPLYKTPENYLLSLVESVRQQTYPNWELCLSDGSGADSPLEAILKKLQMEDDRIKVVSHAQNLRISENTNAAIGIATGDFIVFADHDDALTPNALYECMLALENNESLDVIYSDEDKMSMKGTRFFEPHFKPDFNIDLLCTVNYICHLFVVKKELLDQVGVLRQEFDGAQDYDFILRCIEQAKHIYHIPKILYHWRSHESSTAENPESKLYAFEAGARAVKAHYERIGVAAEVRQGEYLGLYRTRFLRDTDPLISIIIPNKDHIDDLKRCIDAMEEKSTYKNYEYIIVENNSTEEETFAYYKELEASNPKVKVVYWDGIFNYSAINNYGVQYAKGDYYLLLNNDTEIINEDCLEELLGYCMRKDVGAVGARLYYDDDTIQHAGVVIGFGGIAGHCFVQQPRGFSGYCHRIICAQDYSAVTAACMMVKKEAFEKVNGLTEELAVAFNDIDFCLKLREAGYLIVYNPYAELYHYESKSRGLDNTPEKVARFAKEIATFEERWPDILKNGDPFYNPNLTLESQDFSLRRLD